MKHNIHKHIVVLLSSFIELMGNYEASYQAAQLVNAQLVNRSVFKMPKSYIFNLDTKFANITCSSNVLATFEFLNFDSTADCIFSIITS